MISMEIVGRKMLTFSLIILILLHGLSLQANYTDREKFPLALQIKYYAMKTYWGVDV
jgi:hypothetical protein